MRLRPTLVAAIVPGLVALALYCVFSVTRHLAFGSGSWDMGCYVHDLHLLAWALPPVSSVLGDANFWGGTNHFMPSLILAAPLAYTGSTSSLLVLQALLVAGAVVPLSLLAERRGLGPVAVLSLSLAYLFAVGTQSMIAFDVHEIAPVPLLLFAALYWLDVGKRGLAIAALLILAGCKESAILYAAFVGAYLCVFVPAQRRLGAGILVGFALWFVVVVAVIQPANLEPGARMIHVDRFGRGGLVGLLSSALLHPVDTLRMLFTPAPKASTLATTVGGFGFLPLLSPASWLLAAPNLAERFLSNKREMWGLGFHYSLVTVAACTFGALDAMARFKAATVRSESVLGALVVAGLVASNVASPVTPEFASLHKPYMANAGQQARYRRALAVIPNDAPVVAQNHFLPHLAFRQFIWQPEKRFVERADWIVLDAEASPWPHTRAHVEGLVAALSADPRFRVAFREGSTLVLARGAAP